MNERPSLPPGDQSLRTVAHHHRKLNDELEKSVGHMPLPTPTRRATLTEEQRLEVCRELRTFWLTGKSIDLDDAMYEYEQEVKGRLGR